MAFLLEARSGEDAGWGDEDIGKQSTANAAGLQSGYGTRTLRYFLDFNAPSTKTAKPQRVQHTLRLGPADYRPEKNPHRKRTL